MTALAAHAHARFGLGPRPGDLAAAASDPRGWLVTQIGRVDIPAALAASPTGTARQAALQQIQNRDGNPGVERLLRQEWRAAYLRDSGLRTKAMIDSDAPFRERWVAFWSNHFTVSVQRPRVLGLAEPFEREAIRPHAWGSFLVMLNAVVRHPAMLIYLDQAVSAGPNSQIGARRGRGLNENLARELMELHTLGVDGGYTQSDVRELAKILTGFSIGGVEENMAGMFRFRPGLHEPGDKKLLDVTIRESGFEEGLTALRLLAFHPATARHVARKLAAHFVADDPAPVAVEALARTFRDTRGDLAEMARAVVNLRDSWDNPMGKVRTPNDLVVAALRAVTGEAGYAGEPEKLLAALATLGQTPFAAPSPAGWPDTARQWIGPESAMRRAEWALALAERVAAFRRPEAVFAATLETFASAPTRNAIARAPGAVDGLAMLFASPEFQRR
jgi:uncharacterized protein (DUF1800 family)